MADNPEDDDSPERMADALAEIRREGWKAAFVPALVEAVAALLLVNLAVALVEPGWLPARIALSAGVGVPGSVVPAVVVGLVALVVGTWLRVRRPLVEQFEAANPSVAEALRTARDATADATDTRMARRLYASVLDQLRETSSLGLIDLRRVGATLAVVVVVSLATVQVAVFDVTLAGGQAGTDGPTTVEDANFTGLEDSDQVLGDRENVSAGDENLTARVDSTGGDRDVENGEQFPSSPGTGAGSDGGTDSQQAGFAPAEEIEDAELVRKYNSRIREETEE